MTTAWSHLPNARHIDRILADVNANPDNWDRAGDAALVAASDRAWDRAWDATLVRVSAAALDAASHTAWLAVYSAASPATRSTIAALIAWPESAEYLDLSVDSLRVLAELGDHKAVLILPAAIAFELQREFNLLESA